MSMFDYGWGITALTVMCCVFIVGITIVSYRKKRKNGIKSDIYQNTLVIAMILITIMLSNITESISSAKDMKILNKQMERTNLLLEQNNVHLELIRLQMQLIDSIQNK